MAHNSAGRLHIISALFFSPIFCIVTTNADLQLEMEYVSFRKAEENTTSGLAQEPKCA